LAARAAPPHKVEIAYEVAHGGAPVADVVGRLEHDGRSYRLLETWKGKGIYALRGEVRRTSRGSVAAEGLRPAEFEDRRSGREPRRVRFEGTAGAGRQDRLSLLWSFAFRPPGAQPVSLVVADGKGIARHVYVATGRERISTPAGEFDALRLARQADAPQARSAEIWLAADRHWLPVRVVATDSDGTRTEQVAVRIAFP
jgi:hypothetical protein